MDSSPPGSAYADSVSTTTLGGRYLLGALLGRGGMAEVHRARDTLLHRDVAVKVFRDVDVPDLDARRASEVHLLAGLSHPHLVTVFDAGLGGTDDPFAYLVMELVDGTTLRQLLHEGPLPPEQVAGLGAQLADALAYVHARGIVHRDLKPANILVTEPRPGQRLAKLTDFGVARLLDSTRLTVEGSTLGTANYLSPEQATGAAITGASDVYSLGLVLLESLTGAVVYPGHGIEAAVARLHRQPDVPEYLGTQWGALLRAMTARDPAARPDAEQVAAVLRSMSGAAPALDAVTTQLLAAIAPVATSAGPAGGPGPASAAVALPVPRPARRRRGALLAGLAAVAALVVALAIALSTTESDAGQPTAAGPSYPAVSGALGADLRALEQAVGTAEPMHSDVLAIARAAQAGDTAAAVAGLNRLRTDVADAEAAGQLDSATASRILAAAAQIGAALPPASSSPAPSSSSSATPTSSAPSSTSSAPPTTSVVRQNQAPAPKPKPKPAPKPAPKHGPGHHHGKDKAKA